MSFINILRPTQVFNKGAEAIGQKLCFGQSKSFSQPRIQDEFHIKHPPSDDLSPQDLAIIQQQLQQTKYGLAWQWMDPKHRFKLKHTENGLQFGGYHNPKTTTKQGVISGDCKQLAHQTGQILTQKLGGRYKFYLVQGNYPGSPWRAHFFLMGWPAHRDAEYLARTVGKVHPFTKQPRVVIPQDAYLIDPTYGRMAYAGESEKMLNNYFITHPKLLEVSQKLPASAKETIPFTNGSFTDGFPLGFAKDLYPSHPKPHDVVFAHFRKIEDAVEQQALGQSLTAELEVGNTLEDWRELAHTNMPVYPVMARLNRVARRAQ